MEDISSYKLACTIARILDEKIAKDITILNISHVSSFADYFVIASGDVSTQVKALSEGVKIKIRDLFKRQPLRFENDLRNRWNLIDYGDVIVHVLHKEERETYALEKFWSHSCRVSEEDWMKESEEYSEYSNK